jgi:hypothetical protein
MNSVAGYDLRLMAIGGSGRDGTFLVLFWLRVMRLPSSYSPHLKGKERKRRNTVEVLNTCLS